MLPIEAKLDYETLGHVVRSGHSRIPVYQMVEVPDIDLSAATIGPTKTKLVKKILGSLLVKSCVLLDPEDATPLATIPINAMPSVPFDEPLTNMLNVFQEGRSHMAIVSRRPRRIENDPEDAESVMTAAAGGLRQRFMRKVAEISHGGKSSSSGSESGTDASDADTDVERGEKENDKNKEKDKKKRRKDRRKSSIKSEGAPSSSPTSTVGPTPAETYKVQTEQKKKSAIVQAAKLTQLEQTVPSDAQMPPEMVDKVGRATPLLSIHHYSTNPLVVL
jgi:metal transporter CNNM